ncbi:MAG: hypothetical protein AAF531_27055 [Actinomycetota bacterium]
MSATSTRPAGDGQGFGQRVAWSVLSQGLSSVTNFGLTLLLALSVGVVELGRIVSVYSVYLLALTLSRSLTTDALVAASDGSKVIDLPWLWARRRIVALAAAASAVSVLLGLILAADGVIVALIALLMPLLLLQDGLRNLAWAGGRPDLAGLLDGTWLGVSVIGLVVLLPIGPLGGSQIVFVWCLGGIASWVVGRRLVERPGGGGAVAEFRPDLLRYRPMAHSQAIMTVAVNVGPVIVALSVSPAMAAVAKAALLPITPVLSLFAGLRVVTLPTIRRAVDGGNAAGITSLVVGVSALTAAIGGFVSVQIVGRLSSEQLGETLTLIAPNLGWVGLLGIMYVAVQQLSDATALSGRHEVVGRRIATVVVEWGCVVVGAAVAGADGLIVGWVVGLAVATIAWLQPALQP